MQSSYGSYELIRPSNIVTVCFLGDILKATNVLQTVLQSSRLNYLETQIEVENLVKTLNAKTGASEKSTGCFLGQMISLI